MAYFVGIDTGGTYTDAVLVDAKRPHESSVVKKAKAVTTHEALEVGIKNSLSSLNLAESELEAIEKVVISTTLATNAVVEKKLCRVGAILIGDVPNGALATEYIQVVQGRVNIKGRVVTRIDKAEIKAAIEKLAPHVEAIAISGASSVRNPVLEQEVKEIVKQNCNLPVMCGHEFANELGLLERTNTVIVNAGLFPKINGFLDAIEKSLNDFNIQAPCFVVKADGCLSNISVIKKRPVETVLSGPAASIIGTRYLTGLSNAVVLDMGGTTTDIGIVENNNVTLSSEGAQIGDWKLRVKSAELRTIGLGGDSKISITPEGIEIGPMRILSACREGIDGINLTDILHCTNRFVYWDRGLSEKAVKSIAETVNIEYEDFLLKIENAVVDKIYEGSIKPYKHLGLPFCAIGAPAKTWYGRTKEKYSFDLVVPESYEVANAVGAAVAGIVETSVSIIRKGEEGFGFIVHTETERDVYRDINEAIIQGLAKTIEIAEGKIKVQGMVPGDAEVTQNYKYIKNGELAVKALGLKESVENNEFVELEIKVEVAGKFFV